MSYPTLSVLTDDTIVQSMSAVCRQSGRVSRM